MKAFQQSLFLLAVAGLSACASSSSNASVSSEAPLLDSEVLDLVENQPNRLVLGAMGEMSDVNLAASRTTLSADATITTAWSWTYPTGDQNVYGFTDFSIEEILDLDLTAVLDVNEPNSEAPEAVLDVDLNRLESSYTSIYGIQSYTSSLLLEDSQFNVYFDAENAYLDLTQADDVRQYLEFYRYEGVPNQIQFPFDFKGTFNQLLPQANESEIDAWVTAMLPMLDAINLTSKTLDGTTLLISYEITQDDLPVIFEAMYLGTTSKDSLTEEELAFFEQWLADSIAGIDIGTFRLAIELDLLTNQITDVLLDIDASVGYIYEIPFYEYDPENPNADEWGYIVNGSYTIEYGTTYDINLQASMELFSESLPIAIPTNKEEYVLFDIESTPVPF